MPSCVSHACAQTAVDTYGVSTLSAQALAPGYLWLRVGPHTVVPFVVVARVWVAAGPPVGPAALHELGAQRFVAMAQDHGFNAVFFGVPKALAEHAGLAFLPLGEEPAWTPATWHGAPQRHRQVASQVRRAKRHGVKITAVTQADWQAQLGLQAQMGLLVRRWRARQAMPAMGFVVAMHLQPYGAGHRLWLAHAHGVLVGFATGVPVGQAGLLLEHVIRSRSAPNGTAEALVDAAMLDHAQSAWVRLGMVPLAGTLSPFLRMVRRAGGVLYNFSGLAAFKKKLLPDETEALGIAFVGGTGLVGMWRRAQALLWVLRAFAGEGFLRFVWRGVLRGPTPLLVLLTALLPVWTYGLAQLNTAIWFPAGWVHTSWLVFDGLLTVGLALALKWPKPHLYGFLAGVVATDTLVTLAEALFFPGPKTYLGLAMHALGVAAPALSTLVLWGAWRRLRWL